MNKANNKRHAAEQLVNSAETMSGVKGVGFGA